MKEDGGARAAETDRAAIRGPEPSGLRVDAPDDGGFDVFGGPFSDEELSAASEMAAGKGAGRAGARKVGVHYIVRTPLGAGRAHLWRIAPEGPLKPEHIQRLAADSTLIAARTGPEPSAPDDSGKIAHEILRALAATPKAKGARGARIALEAIGRATGWTQVATVRMRRGRAGRVRLVDQFANAKTPSIRIFAEAVAVSGETAFTTAAAAVAGGPDQTAIDVYRDEHGVEHFAIALPEGDGPALYAEGAASCAEIAAARAAYALATGAGPRRAGWSLRPVIAIAAAAAAAVVLSLPTSLDVTAPGRIEPAESEVVVAPYAARLVALEARVGDAVAADAPLARLVSRELAEDETRAAMDGMLEELAAQEALAGDDYAKYQLAQQRSAIAAFRAEQSARRLADLTVRAPAAGSIAFLIPESEVGAMLTAGQPVAEVQYGDALHVRLKVSLGDGPLVKAGMTGEIIVRGVIDQSYRLTVLEDPVALTEAAPGAARTLSVLAAINPEDLDGRLYKGLSGFARLDAGEAPRAWVWARPVIDYARFSLWRYLGLRL